MVGVKSLKVEIFDGAGALAKIGTMASKREVKAVLEVAKLRGFLPTAKPTDVQGFKRTYIPNGAVTEGGLTVTKLDHTYVVQDLKKAGSTDKAAMVVTTFSAPGVLGATEIDVRFLVAPGGDVTKTQEMRFDSATGKVIATNSWWTRFKACISGKCQATCVGSLGTCAFASWAGYLQCVALACGGCSAKCVACATCKCRWWCKWATGCCND